MSYRYVVQDDTTKEILVDEFGQGSLVEKIRADERAKAIEIIESMDFDFGDSHDNTEDIKRMITDKLKEQSE